MDRTLFVENLSDDTSNTTAITIDEAEKLFIFLNNVLYLNGMVLTTIVKTGPTQFASCLMRGKYQTTKDGFSADMCLIRLAI